MRKKIISGLIMLAVFITITSCNKIPQAEIDAVNLSITEAKDAGADMYLPQEFAALQDSMNSVTVQIEAKKSKWFAKYAVETEKLNKVKADAMSVKENTETRKEEIKAEIQTTISNLQTTLAENNELLKVAPKGKEGAAALEAIKEDLKVVEASLTETSTLVADGKLMKAQAKVTAANEKAMSINMELKEAIAKYNKRK